MDTDLLVGADEDDVVLAVQVVEDHLGLALGATRRSTFEGAGHFPGREGRFDLGEGDLGHLDGLRSRALRGHGSGGTRFKGTTLGFFKKF